MRALRGASIVAVCMVLAVSARGDGLPLRASRGVSTEHLFVMFSANAPRAAPNAFARHLEAHDFVRTETLPAGTEVRRRQVYALPTTLRRRWAGEPGLRHWLERGCGADTPGTLVYDPEHWELTPRAEAERFPATVRLARTLTRRSGCHRLGVAPGATFMFGLAPHACEFDLDRATYDEVSWRGVVLVDIQAQRLLDAECDRPLFHYSRVVSFVAARLRELNPRIAVVAQVSFRYSPPARMIAAIRSVAPVVDGIYFSYPTRGAGAPCRYCTARNLQLFLRMLRPI